MKRIFCSLLMYALAATLPLSSVVAAASKPENAKVTLVYQTYTRFPFSLDELFRRNAWATRLQRLR